jgi:hypothetical protein
MIYQMIDRTTDRIVSASPKAMTRVRNIHMADALTPAVVADPSGLRDEISAIAASDLAHHTEALAAEASAGREQGLVLRALGLALDVFANRTGTPEGQQFEPGKTRLGKFLGVSALARLGNRHLLSASAIARPGIELAEVDTEEGPVYPDLLVEANVDLWQPRSRALRKPPFATQPYGVNGDFLRGHWGLWKVQVAAKLALSLTGQEYLSSGLPAARLTLEEPGRLDSLQVYERHTALGSDGYYQNMNNWHGVEQEHALEVLGQLDEIMSNLAERPGTKAAQEYAGRLLGGGA